MDSDIPEVLINADEIKTYDFKAPVLIIDEVSGYNKCKFSFVNPVKVFNDGGELIGSVKLDLSGDLVMGDFSLNYQTPERLTIETKSVPLYPSVSGDRVVERHKGFDVVTEMVIDSVSVTYFPSDDTRIDSL